MSVGFVVSHATFRTRFCLQTSQLCGLNWLVKRRSRKSRILLTKRVLPQFQKVNFESIHCKSNLFDLETDVRQHILCQWGLISREDSDASCPILQLKSIQATTVGMYYLWTLLICYPACEELSSLCISNPPWILLFLLLFYLIMENECLQRTVSLLFLYCLGPKLKIGALMPGHRTYEYSVGPMGLWKNSCMFRSYNSEIQGLALFSQYIFGKSVQVMADSIVVVFLFKSNDFRKSHFSKQSRSGADV